MKTVNRRNWCNGTMMLLPDPMTRFDMTPLAMTGTAGLPVGESGTMTEPKQDDFDSSRVSEHRTA